MTVSVCVPIFHVLPDGDTSRTISKSRPATNDSVSDEPEEPIVHVLESGSFEIDAKPARTTVAADAGAAARNTPKTNADTRRTRTFTVVVIRRSTLERFR